jgi:nicotinate-nucleotide adenylyltransferase
MAERPQTPPPTTTLAIFGGAFDPFHKGHASVIAHLLASPGIDRVVVVPSGDRPDKKNGSRATDRLVMTQRGVSECFPGEPRIEVSAIQVSGHVGFGTIDLAEYYEKDPRVRVLFVIGQELVKDLPQWKDAERLRKTVQFLVLKRPGSENLAGLPGWQLTMARPFSDGGIEISSTEVRKRLAKGEPCAEYIPQSVQAYCVDTKLYSAHKTE